MDFWNFWCRSFERVGIWEPRCNISSLLRWCPKSDQCSGIALHCSTMVSWANRHGSTWSLGREVLIQQITDFNGSQRQLDPDARYHINMLSSLNSTPRCHPREKVKDNSLITNFKIGIVSKLQKLSSLLDNV